VEPTQVQPASGASPAALTAAPAELPATGFPAEQAALAGAVLILIGLALVARARAAQSPAA
jgi:LPXTG-motif cell wall-anchored protein